jgi:hypothetical protein
LQLLQQAEFLVVAVVLDKFTHKGRNAWRLEHPYHYCIMLLLERYVGWLQLKDHTGDVLAESRGGVEDSDLKIAYRQLHEDGGTFLPKERIQSRLTSKEIKLKKKGQNVAGLQVADVLAHPLTRDVLVAYKRIDNRGGLYADRLAALAIASKYNRQIYTGQIRGYGQVIVS